MESFIEPLMYLSDAKFSLQGSIQVIGYRYLAYSATLCTSQKRAAMRRTVPSFAFCPCPFHAAFLDAVRGYLSHHMGIVLFIARNPAARIAIVVAIVVYSHLLYNQSMLVANMQMEVPIGMIKS